MLMLGPVSPQTKFIHFLSGVSLATFTAAKWELFARATRKNGFLPEIAASHSLIVNVNYCFHTIQFSAEVGLGNLTGME